MANEAGIPLEALAGHHGVPAEQTLRKVLAGREEAEIQRWVRRITDLEIADVDGVHAVPGALELLAELNDREIPWTIVTSCTTDLAIARTRAGKIPMPANSVTFDQVSRGKPFPEPFIPHNKPFTTANLQKAELVFANIQPGFKVEKETDRYLVYAHVNLPDGIIPVSVHGL